MNYRLFVFVPRSEFHFFSGKIIPEWFIFPGFDLFLIKNKSVNFIFFWSTLFFRSRYKNKKPVVHVPLTFGSEPGADMGPMARVPTEGVSDTVTNGRRYDHRTQHRWDPGHGRGSRRRLCMKTPLLRSPTAVGHRVGHPFRSDPGRGDHARPQPRTKS